MGVNERKKKHTHDLKNSILNSALKIAKEEGWDSVSTRKIAEEIEYSTTAIYHYFGNKNAILMELQRNGFTLLIKNVEDKSKQYKTLSERLLQISLCYFDFSDKNQELYKLMFNLGVNSKEKPFDLIMRLKKLVLEIILEITDIDSEEIFMNWWAIVHGFVTISFIDLFICDKTKTLEILENSILRFTESLLMKK